MEGWRGKEGKGLEEMEYGESPCRFLSTWVTLTWITFESTRILPNKQIDNGGRETGYNQQVCVKDFLFMYVRFLHNLDFTTLVLGPTKILILIIYVRFW